MFFRDDAVIVVLKLFLFGEVLFLGRDRWIVVARAGTVGVVLVGLAVALLVGLVRVGLVLGGLGVAVVVCGVVCLVRLVRGGLICLGLVRLAVSLGACGVLALLAGGVLVSCRVVVFVLLGVVGGLRGGLCLLARLGLGLLPVCRVVCMRIVRVGFVPRALLARVRVGLVSGEVLRRQASCMPEAASIKAPGEYPTSTLTTTKPTNPTVARQVTAPRRLVSPPTRGCYAFRTRAASRRMLV